MKTPRKNRSISIRYILRDRTFGRRKRQNFQLRWSCFDIELNNEITSKLRTRRAKRNDEYESMISSASVEMDATLDAEQARFADAIINSLDEMFADGDEAVELPNVELSVEGWIRKRTISLAEIQSAILTVDSEIANTIERQAINAQAILTDTYGESLTLTLTGTGIVRALNADDLVSALVLARPMDSSKFEEYARFSP